MTKPKNSMGRPARYFTSVVVTAALLFSMLPVAFAQTFNDVLSNNRNITAIEFLAANGIVNGYPDGTFKPDKPVSRVEFLKLALLSSQVKLDATAPSGFKDVDENAWYAPYVRKAKQAGWIQGYGDGTFKPDQGVNKVEGLKMIAEIQNWQLPTVAEMPYKDVSPAAWYAPFVTYAKAHNFLEETGSFFIPAATLSRAKTSEMLFRALITKAAGAQIYSADLINEVTSPLPGFPPSGSATTQTSTTTTTSAPANFTPVTYHTVGKTFFDNITLDQDFPNIFYANEFYTFKGKINTGTFDTAFAFLRDGNDQNFENTSDAIKDGSFSIPVIFRKPGNYKLGIIPGSSSESKYVEISVLASLPQGGTSGSSTVPSALRVGYANQKTTFGWNNGSDNLAKITLTQGGTSKTFFTRQDTKQFEVIYNDFQEFSPGQISYRVESAKTSQIKPLNIDTPWVSSATQTFTATQHTFSETHKDLISYTSLPEIMPGPGNITISGTTLSDIFKSAAVIRPDGKVDNVDMPTNGTTFTYVGETVIPSGSSYSFNYRAATSGTYIVEINGKDGLAVINTPVYVNDGTPLTPDFFDLSDSSNTTDANISTNILTNRLLQLINQERTKYGLGTVRADSTLNQLAQNHADDMWNRGFFGHINPDGLTPDDRRKALGITTEVGENLARAPNLLYAHNGLMRSAIHRVNILEPDWTRVGLGIAKTSDDYLLVVEEFSTDPLDAAKISSIKSSFFDQINQKRQSSGISVLSLDSTLASVADNWSNEMVNQNFFDFTAPDGSSLTANVQKAEPNKSVQLYILESSSQSQLLDQILASTQVLSGQWRTIGIGLQADKNGVLELTLLLST